MSAADLNDGLGLSRRDVLLGGPGSLLVSSGMAQVGMKVAPFKGRPVVDQRSARTSSQRYDRYTHHEVIAPRVGGPSGRTKRS